MRSIHWSAEEYEIVFKQIDEYVENYKLNIRLGNAYKDFPNLKDPGILWSLQSLLPAERRKKFTTSFAYILRIKYIEYIATKNSSTSKVKKEKVGKTILDCNLNDVTLIQFGELFDAKLVVLYKTIKTLIEELHKSLPSKIIETILSQDVTNNQIVKEPQVDVSTVTTPEPVIEKSHIIDTTFIVDSVKPLVSQSVSITSDSSSNYPQMFTEAEIRKIVREEIENIFGPIKTETKKHDPVLKALIQTTLKPENPVSTETPIVRKASIISDDQNKPALVNLKPTIVTKKDDPDLVENQKFKPKSIYIFGLNTSQIDNIQITNRQVTIKGGVNLNQSTRDQVKNSDLVLVTKFSKHSEYATFQSLNDNVEFISGGLSMIKRRIKNFAGIK